MVNEETPIAVVVNNFRDKRYFMHLFNQQDRVYFYLLTGSEPIKYALKSGQMFGDILRSNDSYRDDNVKVYNDIVKNRLVDNSVPRYPYAIVTYGYREYAAIKNFLAPEHRYKLFYYNAQRYPLKSAKHHAVIRMHYCANKPAKDLIRNLKENHLDQRVMKTKNGYDFISNLRI